ncbi:hypothetical protein BH10BAC5_BH10BAC5_03740 [soil metagenome]
MIILKNSTIIGVNVIFLMFFGQVFAQNWSQLPTSGNPDPRGNSSAIYIESNNRIIVFGGRGQSGSYNDIQSLNLNTNSWQNITPTTGTMPAARFSQNAFYDSLKNRMIIWSGQGAELYNDVWAFNFNTNSWQQLWIDGNVSGAPLKRYGTAAVFDPVKRRIVTFAGFTTSGRFEDTWYFQVDSLKWKDETNSFHPELRCLHTACISSDKQKMIIYAGQHSGALDDLWSLDLLSFQWTQLNPPVKPQGRYFSGAVYTKFDKVIIFGGQSGSSIFGDLWKYDQVSNSWDSIAQRISKPSARYGHATIYIPSSDKIIIFGGNGSSYSNDTWQFGSISTTGIENGGAELKGFNLHQNFPNPFNPSTTIRYEIPVNSRVTITIYDVRSREIKTLINEDQNSGEHSVSFDGKELSSGVYFYKIDVLDSRQQQLFSDIKRSVLIK